MLQLQRLFGVLQQRGIGNENDGNVRILHPD
jgi:hypothetical protein